MPKSQIDFDDQDVALTGNKDGIGIRTLATFSIPETQMQKSDTIYSGNNIHLHF